MRAVCWHGHGDVRVDTVPDPELNNHGDVIIKVTAAGICGSDLHSLDGYMPTMESGDILGHETMGVVVDTGSKVKRVTHRLKLEQAPQGYKTFRDKKDGCIKVMLQPGT